MKQLFVLMAVLAILAPASSAQQLWGDGFENYVPVAVPGFGNQTGGVNGLGNGGWDSWYQTAVVADGGISTAFAHSGNNSLEISGPGVGGTGCDVVQDHSEASASVNGSVNYDLVTFPRNPLESYPRSVAAGGTAGVHDGQWQYRAWNYCPGSLPQGTDSHYFIVNDNHNNAGASSGWIMQVQFNHLSGTVADDQRTPAVAANIQYDTWVEIVATFDLDNDLASVSYGGQNIGFGPVEVSGWNVQAGTPQIGNLDLFTIGASSFWDDVTLTKIASGPLFQTNNADATNFTGIDMDLNGDIGHPLGAVVSDIVGGVTPFIINAATGQPGGAIEILYQVGHALPANGGGLAFAPGVILNVSLNLGVTTFFLGDLPPPFGNSGTLFAYTAGQLVNTVLPALPAGSSIPITMQGIQLPDPVAPAGFSLSQPCSFIWR